MLRNYFKPKVRKNVPTTAAAAGSMTAGKIECPYCYGWYFSQGMPAHIRKHEANGEAPQMRARSEAAKPKLRVKNPDGSLSTLTSGETTAQLKREAMGGKETPEEETIVIESSDDEMGGDERDAANDTAMGKTPEDSDEEEDDDNMVDNGAIELANEDIDVDGDAPTAAKAKAVRSRNWKVVEKVDILDEYVEKKNEGYGLKRFCKHIEGKYKRNLQPRTFRMWRSDEVEIRASGALQKSDRRMQSKPREKVGKYPDMECELAEKIRGMRQFGIVVETWMVDVEARLILHKRWMILNHATLRQMI
mmetsp:Transcript_30700/g.52513  ORF Transcript_30700/g.52513 Transcript_30700/m.52513 type:complete len:305 (-) Transcript_30700:662-1576(-)